MNLKEIKGGIEIASRYYDKPDGYHLSAEHEQIWLHSTNRPMSQQDVQNMIDLGWFQEDVEGDFTAEIYDPDEAWTAYV